MARFVISEFGVQKRAMSHASTDTENMPFRATSLKKKEGEGDKSIDRCLFWYKNGYYSTVDAVHNGPNPTVLPMGKALPSCYLTAVPHEREGGKTCLSCFFDPIGRQDSACREVTSCLRMQSHFLSPIGQSTLNTLQRRCVINPKRERQVEDGVFHRWGGKLRLVTPSTHTTTQFCFENRDGYCSDFSLPRH